MCVCVYKKKLALSDCILWIGRQRIRPKRYNLLIFYRYRNIIKYYTYMLSYNMLMTRWNPRVRRTYHFHNSFPPLFFFFIKSTSRFFFSNAYIMIYFIRTNKFRRVLYTCIHYILYYIFVRSCYTGTIYVINTQTTYWHDTYIFILVHNV